VTVPDEPSKPDASHRSNLAKATSWLPQPARHPDLRGDAAHVWLADLDEIADNSLSILSRNELERAERLLDPRVRTRWTSARRLLRELIGGYLRVPPKSLRFEVGAHGKPALVPFQGHLQTPPALAFNLSHSGPLALYAFTCSGQVGVDVQLPRTQLDELALAGRHFGEEHAGRLAELEPQARQAAFLRAWTNYEATLKWRGTGISATPREEPRPWLGELDLGRGGAAALALDEEPEALCCWTVGS
jgi:4'-phosphopantetheinyl transferase